MRGGKHRDTE
ncbi:Protein of unknown function [Bacillus mycoides]|nr:Protein of unknown function [Bacillus mycoides]